MLDVSKGPPHVPEVPPMHPAAMRRAGTDPSIFSHSRHALLTREAADARAREGIEAEVIALGSLKPIDGDTRVASLEKTRRMRVVEEDRRFAGAGAEISAPLGARCFATLGAPVQRLARLDISTPFSGALEATSIPQVADIRIAARAVRRPALAAPAAAPVAMDGPDDAAEAGPDAPADPKAA